MKINDTKYPISINNYVFTENIKKQIVLGNTFNHDMKHVIGWNKRFNGKYKKTTPFTIDINGMIYKHFEPKYQSLFFNVGDLDDKSIVILIENDGWLVKDIEKNQFIGLIGDIYKEPNKIVDKKWRGYNYWAPYNEKQIESAINLINKLCKDFEIPVTCVNHNTKIDNLIDYKGVLYKSNLGKNYTDLNPTWNFEEFKNKLEVK